MVEDATRSAGDDQDYQDRRGRPEVDSLLGVPGRKRQNAGMETSDYE